jgi:hypothetical protein
MAVVGPRQPDRSAMAGSDWLLWSHFPSASSAGTVTSSSRHIALMAGPSSGVHDQRWPFQTSHSLRSGE